MHLRVPIEVRRLFGLGDLVRFPLPLRNYPFLPSADFHALNTERGRRSQKETWIFYAEGCAVDQDDSGRSSKSAKPRKDSDWNVTAASSKCRTPECPCEILQALLILPLRGLRQSLSEWSG